LATLRWLEPAVKEEVEKMPIVIDIMENQIIGPAIRKGLEMGREEGREKGREEGRQEGREEGLAEGEQRLLRRQIEKRFGPISDWAIAKLASLPIAEIEVLGEGIFDAPSLESLLK
jgi:predicted transposase YdaD